MSAAVYRPSEIYNYSYYYLQHRDVFRNLAPGCLCFFTPTPHIQKKII